MNRDGNSEPVSQTRVKSRAIIALFSVKSNGSGKNTAKDEEGDGLVVEHAQ